MAERLNTDHGKIDWELVSLHEALEFERIASQPELAPLRSLHLLAAPLAAAGPVLITRAQWGARAPKSVSTNITPGLGGCAFHYEGPTMGTWDHSQCAGKVRGIQAFHMDSRGWADIAYNYIVCPHGFVFEGRGIFVRSAAQGTNEGNQNWYAICGLFGVNDPLTAEMKNAYAMARSICVTQGKAALAVKPHSAFHATGCPGDPVRAFIPTLDGKNPSIPVPPPTPSGTPILMYAGMPATGWDQAQAWARSRGATEEFVSLAPLYWWFAGQRGGVRAEVAYAQSAKETGFGRFGGVIDASYHNPCGLKTTSGGSNTDPNAHMRFPDWQTGIVAHLDHLALYAGAPGYPRTDTPDPRHFSSIAGKAKTVEALGGAWAPAGDYGTSIRDSYLLPMMQTSAPPPQETRKMVVVYDKGGRGEDGLMALGYAPLFGAEGVLTIPDGSKSGPDPRAMGKGSFGLGTEIGGSFKQYAGDDRIATIKLALVGEGIFVEPS